MESECRDHLFLVFICCAQVESIFATACRSLVAAPPPKPCLLKIKSAIVLAVAARAKGLRFIAYQYAAICICITLHRRRLTYTHPLLNGEKIASLNITHRREQQELSLCREHSVNFASMLLLFGV